jgi:hypothetical protein
VPTGKRIFCRCMSMNRRMATRGGAAVAAADGGTSSVPQRGDGMHRGIADVSWSSAKPTFAGSVCVVEQLHDEAICGGSHGPVALLPAPRERSICHARP